MSAFDLTGTNGQTSIQRPSIMKLRAAISRVFWRRRLKAGIPPAIEIDTIEKPGTLHILAVLEQAKENVKASSAIDSVAIDRGFPDGKVPYQIDLQGVEFVIPLKRNMEATKDARQLALCGGSAPVTREIEATNGYGKKKYTQKVVTIPQSILGGHGFMLHPYIGIPDMHRATS
ncbi:MAG: hypothetical protein JRJ77_14235 [Deltaproteobacteria bacterium]|nr:hypothetical protein [Deltaproteobacteria bacterium]MBW2341961.1 hypothetical protein [Deltaproteobacteria bacterium]